MTAESNEPEVNARPAPPLHTRLIGRTICRLALSAPWTWPLIEGSVRRFFDDRSDGWDERTGAGSVDHLAALAAAMVEIGPEPERILDIGAGTGEGSLFLAREFPRARIRGIDLSPAMIERARAKVGLDPEGRIAFRVADAAALPFEANSFDLIVQTNVPVFMAEIDRVLRPDGAVALTASLGRRTPFYTDHRPLGRAFKRRGFALVAEGEIRGGTYLVARRHPTGAQ
jgi:ubiquinone/menaquinone biosynthesis C-methylase UbiE